VRFNSPSYPRQPYTNAAQSSPTPSHPSLLTQRQMTPNASVPNTFSGQQLRPTNPPINIPNMGANKRPIEGRMQTQTGKM